MKFLFLIAALNFINVDLYASGDKFLKSVKQKNGFQVKEIDINGDRKIDRIETFQNGKLKTLELDTDYKGKMNHTTTYFDFISNKSPIEVTKIDKNYDGKIDRIESVYKDVALDLFITTHEVDSKYSGAFDKKFTTQTKITQKKNGSGEIVCAEEHAILSDLKILKFSSDVQNVSDKLHDGFFVMGNGYRVHESCMKKWGADEFPKRLNTSMNRGFQCLKGLAQKNIDEKRSPNGALENLNKLDYLLASSPVSIICNQQKYDWDGTSAHASTGPSDFIQENGKTVNHPYISINKNDPKGKAKPTQDELVELSKTLFHEQIHNLGIRHNHNIEYAYTCETCCLSDEEGEQKENACKICAGTYTGTDDKNYLKDLIKWGKTSAESDRVSKAINKYQKEFKQDRWAIFALADANSDIFSPLGIAMSKLLKSKFTNLTDEEKAHLQSAEEHIDVEALKRPDLTQYADIAAEAMYSNYFDANQKQTLDRLESQKETLKTLLMKSKTATGNDSYIYQGLKDKIENIISDIWMDGYPNNKSKESDRAYDLMNDIGLL